MKRMPTIKSVMTPFPYSIQFDARVKQAREMMAETGVRHLAVVREGKLVGVVTAREVELALDPVVGSSPGDEPRVGDMCAMEAYIVGLSVPLDRVLMHMAPNHIGCALVVKDSKLVGIFTVTDACRGYGELLQSIFPSGGDEAA